MTLIQMFITYILLLLISLLVTMVIEIKIQNNRKAKEISERFYRMVDNDVRHKMFDRVQKETRDM